MGGMSKKSPSGRVSAGGNAIVVLVTASSQEEAERIGRRLVEDRLAACANVVPNLRSLFFWEGKLCQENEVLLIIKSTRGKFGKLAECVKGLHSYSVPEIIALPIAAGSAAYLKWVRESTKS